ncbi:hypothetical protein A5893_06535 [Pedobacter psychrophilus]|uniref:Histidine kinase/HSP90-like ATPase domain-containing protein n=1 Tax=Pedobacter psychrophilus TaxID=1826909 RepID=A0A179DHP5_9SPHI|nr:sensor histidine kinase [Pedobacter psychrophilus]OAQ40596.1 hypothetical protein A5893_06535 [Pedobacter psychrophilus]
MLKIFHFKICISIFSSFLLLSFQTNAQQVNVDSLKTVIRTSKVDSTKMLAMRKLASYQILHQGEDEEGLALLNKAEAIARKINFQKGICEVLLTKGNYYFRKNDWANSIKYFRELENQAPSIPDETLKKLVKMKALNNLAGIYSKNADYTTALDYYFKSRALLEKMKPDDNAKCIIYVNIASHYSMLKQPKKAAEYLDLCYPLLKSSKPYLTYLYWSQRMDLAHEKGNASLVKATIDSLENNLSDTSLSDYQKDDYKLVLYDMKAQYEQTYLKNIPAALNAYQQKLKLALDLNNNAEIYQTMCQLGEVYSKNKQNAIATKYLQNAYQGAKKDSINQVAYSAAKLLGQIYQSQSSYDSAYYYTQAAADLNENITSQQNMEQLNFLEAGYQNEKKEKTIAQLKLSEAEAQLTATKKNRLLLAVGISAAALILVFGFAYRNNHQKRIIAEKDKALQSEQVKFLERQQQVVSLQSMLNGQETERTRIAKDLHDGLGGLFSTIKMQLSTLKHEEKTLENNELFQKSYVLVDSAAVEVRRIAHNMMPEVLIKIGLIPAVQELCNSINAGKLIDVSMQHYGMEERLNPSTEMMLFRIIQELLNNIIKHAYASKAIIQFNREDERLSITVEDNGRGFDMSDNNLNTAGLESVRSRVNYLKGKLAIDSEQEIGTTVLMDFLLNKQ